MFILINAIFILAAMFGQQSFAEEPKKCEQPTYRCDCAPNVPFESWIMYMIETCGKDEQWYQMEYRGTQYNDRAECAKAIETTVDCPNSK